MEAKIGNSLIGRGHPCFITFEIGPTHGGLESALRLVGHAAAAGADGVKVQMSSPDRLISDKSQLFRYKRLKEGSVNELVEVEEPLYEILKRRVLTRDELIEIKRCCADHGLAFMSTVGFHEDVDTLVELGCDSIKIASADINHFALIRYAARTGLCMQLDTGMASLGEVEAAVGVIRGEGNNNIIVHHCPSGYPASLETINLRVISTLKNIIPCPIAFSDHSPGVEFDIAALALGANMIEKVITEDRATPSVEHVMAVEVGDAENFVATLRDIDVSLGDGFRHMSTEERVKRTSVRRSLFLSAPMAKGQVIKLSDLEFRRPGFGITPNHIDRVVGARVRHDLSENHVLEWADVEVIK